MSDTVANLCPYCGAVWAGAHTCGGTSEPFVVGGPTLYAMTSADQWQARAEAAEAQVAEWRAALHERNQLYVAQVAQVAELRDALLMKAIEANELQRALRAESDMHLATANQRNKALAQADELAAALRAVLVASSWDHVGRIARAALARVTGAQEAGDG